MPAVRAAPTAPQRNGDQPSGQEAATGTDSASSQDMAAPSATEGEHPAPSVRSPAAAPVAVASQRLMPTTAIRPACQAATATTATTRRNLDHQVGAEHVGVARRSIRPGVRLACRPRSPTGVARKSIRPPGAVVPRRLARRKRPFGIGNRQIAEAALGAAIGDQSWRRFVDRHPQRAARSSFQPFQAGVVAARHQRLPRRSRAGSSGFEQQPHHRQRQRFVIGPLVFDQHRHPPRNAVEVDQRYEMPGTGRIRLIFGKVGAEAGPRGQRQVAPLNVPGGNTGSGNRPLVSAVSRFVK